MNFSSRAFTLIEVVLSIFLLGIIILFLYGALDNLQKGNHILSANAQKMRHHEEILKLLYDDLQSADDLKIKGLDQSLVQLRTANSLYDIDEPYVSWFVERERKRLLRVESVLPFSSMRRENRGFFNILEVGEGCEHFKIYQSKSKEKLLIHLQCQGEDPIVYEFFKPLNKLKIKSKEQNGTVSPPRQKHK